MHFHPLFYLRMIEISTMEAVNTVRHCPVNMALMIQSAYMVSTRFEQKHYVISYQGFLKLH